MKPRLTLILLVLLPLLAGLMARVVWRSPSQPGVAMNEQHPGYSLYKRLGCHKCHGLSITGTHKAPTLAGISDRWTLDGLTRFLSNPDSVREADPRIEELAQRYPDHGMPAYPIRHDALVTVGRFLLDPES